MLVGGKRKRSGGKDDVEAAKRAVLQGVPGVSEAVAEALLATFGSVRKVVRAQPNDLANVKAGKKERRVGMALATRLVAAFNE